MPSAWTFKMQADLDRAKPKLHLSEDASASEIDSPLLASISIHSEIRSQSIRTTTISIRPTHMALLQTPVVHVESACPAGVQ